MYEVTLLYILHRFADRVTLNGGVYDVTKFLDAHPGGANRIRMVNGLDLKHFWKVYDLHDRPHIRQLLEHYRIGTLTAAGV